MLILKKQLERGDTLIEVIIAVTVFSLVAIGCLNIMNQGSSTAERALEISLVRAQVDNQAQVLRFLNSSFNDAFSPNSALGAYSSSTPAGQWALMEQFIINHPVSTVQGYQAVNGNCPTPNANSFILDTRNVKFINPSGSVKLADASTFSQLVYSTESGAGTLQSAQGLWIQATRSSTDPNSPNQGYIDFHIDACWDGPGGSVPVTLGTIVRLYAPRS